MLPCSSGSTRSTGSRPPTTTTTIPCGRRWSCSASARAEPSLSPNGIDDRGRGALRRASARHGGPRRDRSRRPRGRVRGHPWPKRGGQDDVPALDQPADRPDGGGHPRRRADGEPGPAAHVQHHGHPQIYQRGARADPRREPAPTRDGPGLRHAHRGVPPGADRGRRPSPGPHARGHRRDLRRRRPGMRRAAVFVGAVVFAWLVWDTGADPVRLVQGLPWILDFARRTIPPDPRVLPAALAGALTTVEIALLGTAVAAALALPLGFLSARNVAPGAVFYPARAVLNFFRSF